MADERARDTRVAILADPNLRDYKVVGGLDTFANRSSWPNFFSRLVARLQWSPAAIDLAADAREWQELPEERRGRLMTLLAGFCVAEDAVAEQLAPFADAAREATLVSQESLMAWVFFLQRRDEQRHARAVRPHRRRGPGVAGRRRGRAACRRPRPCPGRLPRALRGAAAGDGRRARRGTHRAERGHQPLPHAARGRRLRRRAARAARRSGRRRPAGGARGHRARRARRALARRLRPALPDRDRAEHRAARRPPGAGRARRPRSGATPSRPPRASTARARSPTASTWLSSSRRPRWRSGAGRDRARTRAASRRPERRPSRQAAERTPAMSAPASRTTGRSSARRAPASATCRPAACASATSAASASGESQSSSPRPSLTAVSSRQAPTPAARATRGSSSGGSGA